MLAPISLPGALVAVLALSSGASARRAHDRSLGARSPVGDRHRDWANHLALNHKRAEAVDSSNIAAALAAIHSSLQSLANQPASGSAAGENDLLDGILADSHQASLASAVMLVAKSSENKESAKAEGDREKALREKTEKARAEKEKKAAELKSAARHSRVLAFKASKTAAAKTASSKKAAAKLRSARQASSSKRAASLSKSRATSSRHAAHSKSVSAHSASNAAHASSQSAQKAAYSSSKAASRSAKASSIAAHKSSVSAAHASSSSSHAAAEASVKAAASAKKAVKLASSKSKTTKTTTGAKAAATSGKKGTVLAAAGGSSSGGDGLIGFSSSNCGSSQASESEPNGSESFLNCGLSKSSPNSGWTPPKGVTVDMLKAVSIESALASNSVWQPCKPYISLFEKWGASTGLPPIMLAAIALQESTCNPNDSGDNGSAVGLMQIVDKCGGLSKSACAEPDFNIGVGAKYLASQLSQYNGDVLLALGSYNGWYSGLTYSAATAAAKSSCCDCQQNLDYLYQMLNGWLLGKTGYEMGSIGNLDVCGDD